MTDFNDDPSADQADGWAWQGASEQLWNTSIDFSHMGDQAWLDGDYVAAHDFYQDVYQFEDFSNASYQEAWDAWNGPVNAEGYSMHDASLGYTSTDTSFIEPASAASSGSMISDYTAQSSL